MSSLAASLAQLPAGGFWALVLLMLAGCGAGLIGAFTQLRHARRMEDLPTSRIRSAAQGYVELEGVVQLMPGPDIVSPLSGARCAWWQYRVEHLETDEDGRRPRWRTLESATSDSLFLLLDGSGACVIDPVGATVHPSLHRRWRGRSRRPGYFPRKTEWLPAGRYRYSEQLLRIGEPLYALGWFHTQGQAMQQSHAQAQRDLLREWKADPQELRRRFDANGDGQIDAQEWEQARSAAATQVHQEQLARALEPDLHLLRRPDDRRPYLLSVRPQSALIRRHRLLAAACLTLGLASGASASWALGLRGLSFFS